MSRIYNFNPGPSTLPLAALEIAQAEFTDYKGTGMSVLEISHRSKDFEAILANTKELFRSLLGIPENYQIIFSGGGASLQFAMVPMNFIPAGASADYVVTGEWARRAFKEANIVARGRLAASSEADNFSWLPAPESWDLDPAAAYVHMTSNNTIFGTQYHQFPDLKNKYLVCDMSSDILSHQFDIKKFAMIYAGAQKNLGPSGVTVSIIRDDFAASANKGLPTMLTYDTHIKHDSLYNTPPVFPIYIMQLTLQWVKELGGLAAMEAINRKKAELVYAAIDGSDGFYRGTVRTDSRSWMNIPFRLGSEELEATFIAEAKGSRLLGLKGHRSVGGIRVSLYNAMTVEGVEKLVEFMQEFKAKH